MCPSCPLRKAPEPMSWDGRLSSKSASGILFRRPGESPTASPRQLWRAQERATDALIQQEYLDRSELVELSGEAGTSGLRWQ
jgi:hypothetical protein